MSNLAIFRGNDREAANDTGPSDMDREAMRDWIQMLRKEAGSLRSQAQHMLDVAEEAETMAGRLDFLLKSR